MTYDKDREDKNDAYDVALKILSLGNTESTPDNIADIINKHATESAEQARKEAAERVASAWREHGEDITLRTLRTAILDDSTAAPVPDIGKKLAIAVNALKDIGDKHGLEPGAAADCCNIAANALKEIQK